MKSILAALLCLAPIAAAKLFLTAVPAQQAAALGAIGRGNMEPPCANVKCGRYECPEPFTLKVDQTCCGYCWAPDAKVQVDRHQVVEFNATGHAIDQCDSAPSHCKGPGPTP